MKPNKCKNCGEKPEVEFNSMVRSQWVVTCWRCALSGPSSELKQESISLWNRIKILKRERKK